MEKLFVSVLQAELEKAGYRSTPLNETEKLWVVLPNQGKVCTIIDVGVRFESDFMQEKHSDTVMKIISDTREFTALYNKAPVMDGYGVPGYRKLGDMGNYVLAAKLMQNDRIEFVTWQYSYDRKNIGLGHYIYDYREAQKDFLERTGLVPKCKTGCLERIIEMITSQNYWMLSSTKFFVKSWRMKPYCKQKSLLRKITSNGIQVRIPG